MKITFSSLNFHNNGSILEQHKCLVKQNGALISLALILGNHQLGIIGNRWVARKRVPDPMEQLIWGITGKKKFPH